MSLRAVARKEFLHLRRDRRMLAFVFCAPVLLLFLFGYAIRLQLANAPMVVYDADRSFFSQQVRDHLWRSERFVSHEVGTEAAVREALQRGQARAGVIIPAGFSQALSEGRTGRLELLLDGTMPTIALAARYDAGEVLGDDELIGELRLLPPDAEPPAELPPVMEVVKTTLYNPDLKDQAFFLPGVVGILIMQVTLVLASLSLVRERETRTLEQLLVTPIGRRALLVGKLLPYGLIAGIDFVLILGIATTVFEVPMAGSVAELGLVGAVYILGFLSLGMLLSTVSETQAQAFFLAVFVLIPSLLLSGFVFPVEAMPEVLQPLPKAIPLYYFLILVRGIMLKGAGLATLWPEFVALVAFSMLFLVVSGMRVRKTLA